LLLHFWVCVVNSGGCISILRSLLGNHGFVIESILDQLSVFQQRFTSISECLVHLMDRLEVLFFELRVDKVNNFLKGLVANHVLQWFTAQRRCVSTLWAFLALRIRHKVLVNACFTERAHALVDRVSISKETFTQRALKEDIEIRLPNCDPIVLLLSAITV
jgi:hypothetical protein